MIRPLLPDHLEWVAELLDVPDSAGTLRGCRMRWLSRYSEASLGAVIAISLNTGDVEVSVLAADGATLMFDEAPKSGWLDAVKGDVQRMLALSPVNRVNRAVFVLRNRATNALEDNRLSNIEYTSFLAYLDLVLLSAAGIYESGSVDPSALVASFYRWADTTGKAVGLSRDRIMQQLVLGLDAQSGYDIGGAAGLLHRPGRGIDL